MIFENLISRMKSGSSMRRILKNSLNLAALFASLFVSVVEVRSFCLRDGEDHTAVAPNTKLNGEDSHSRYLHAIHELIASGNLRDKQAVADALGAVMEWSYESKWKLSGRYISGQNSHYASHGGRWIWSEVNHSLYLQFQNVCITHRELLSEFGDRSHSLPVQGLRRPTGQDTVTDWEEGPYEYGSGSPFGHGISYYVAANKCVTSLEFW